MVVKSVASGYARGTAHKFLEFSAYIRKNSEEHDEKFVFFKSFSMIHKIFSYDCFSYH